MKYLCSILRKYGQFLGASPADPHQRLPWTLFGDFSPSDPLHCPPLEKNPAGAHVLDLLIFFKYGVIDTWNVFPGNILNGSNLTSA